MAEVTYQTVTWTTGDVITEAKLDNMVNNDQAVDAHNQGIEFAERTAPSTPASNKVHLFSRDDGTGVSGLYFLNDAGTEVSLNGNEAEYLNAIRNPRFEIDHLSAWLPVTLPTSFYAVDGWRCDRGASDSITSVSTPAFTLGQTTVPGNPKRYFESAFVGASGSGDYYIISQRIESVATFSGKEVTLTFYANGTSISELGIEFVQSFGTGGSPSTIVTGIGSTKKTLTGTFTKYSVTVTLPSISGKTLGSNNDDYLGVNFWVSAGSSFSARSGGISPQTGTIRLAEIVLSEGSNERTLQPRNLSDENSLNERYAYTPEEGMYIPATVNTGTVVWFTIQLPTSMRATPTISGLVEGTNMSVYSVNNSVQTGFTFTLADASEHWVKIQASKSSHGLTNPVLKIDAVSPVISAEL